MDSPILALVIAIFFVFYTLIAESQRIPNPTRKAVASPSPPPRPLPVSPPRPRPPPSVPRKINRPRNLPHHGRKGQPQKKGKLNAGKKVGLMFIGIAAIVQVLMVAFLLIRRRQLFNAENGL